MKESGEKFGEFSIHVVQKLVYAYDILIQCSLFY